MKVVNQRIWVIPLVLWSLVAQAAQADVPPQAIGDLIDPAKLAIVVVGEAKAIKADLETIAPVTIINQPSAAPEDKPKDDTTEG